MSDSLFNYAVFLYCLLYLKIMCHFYFIDKYEGKIIPYWEQYALILFKLLCMIPYLTIV